eukprot:gene11215-4037_t
MIHSQLTTNVIPGSNQPSSKISRGRCDFSSSNISASITQNKLEEFDSNTVTIETTNRSKGSKATLTIDFTRIQHQNLWVVMKMCSKVQNDQGKETNDKSCENIFTLDNKETFEYEIPINQQKKTFQLGCTKTNIAKTNPLYKLRIYIFDEDPNFAFLSDELQNKPIVLDSPWIRVSSKMSSKKRKRTSVETCSKIQKPNSE